MVPRAEDGSGGPLLPVPRAEDCPDGPFSRYPRAENGSDGAFTSVPRVEDGSDGLFIRPQWAMEDSVTHLGYQTRERPFPQQVFNPSP